MEIKGRSLMEEPEDYDAEFIEPSERKKQNF